MPRSKDGSTEREHRRGAGPKKPPRRASFAAEPAKPLRRTSPPAEAKKSTLRRPALPPEEHLARAMAAKTARGRALAAQRGLASRARLDRTVHAMLLRQLYLAYFEQRAFVRAVETAEGALELDVLPDVLHQDLARAWFARGEVERAATHLRTAARIGPPSRRAFHWWTLGSVLLLARRYPEALGALARAARWGTRDKALYRAHAALARLLSGAKVPDLVSIIRQLREVPAGRGYGRFILGELSYRAGLYREAHDDLRVFVDGTRKSRAAIAIALEAEVAMAEATLERVERELAQAS